MIDGRIAAAKTAVGSTLYSAPMRARISRVSASTSRARLRVVFAGRNRRAERDERARTIADGVADHFGQLPREGPLRLLDALAREDVILEHQVVGDRRRHDDQVRAVRGERGVNAARSSPA